jgi:hypothetical protein
MRGMCLSAWAGSVLQGPKLASIASAVSQVYKANHESRQENISVPLLFPSESG